MVLFHLENQIGFICLNRPEALNALNEEIYSETKKQILSWTETKSIKALCIYSSSDRFFSAGGDVKSLILRAGKNDQTLNTGKTFFTQEYEFDLMLHNLSIPKIALASGILMGGGMGVFQACNIRVVQKNILVAMPEVSIGLFPDVGASSFLQRDSGQKALGPFCGITGARFGVSEMTELDLCDLAVACEPSHIVNELKSWDWSKGEDKNSIERHLKEKFALSKERVSSHSLLSKEERELISALGNCASLIEFDEMFLGSSIAGDFVEPARKFYKNGSPLSRNIIFQQLFLQPKPDIKEAFKSEWNLAMNCLEKGDFMEGVRALLIDKDKTPNWKYKSLGEVPGGLVADFFNRGDNPLK